MKITKYSTVCAVFSVVCWILVFVYSLAYVGLFWVSWMSVIGAYFGGLSVGTWIYEREKQ